MDLETRARSAAQGIRRAVEVMEVSTDTKQPRKVERFDHYQDRKNRNRKVGALVLGTAVAVIVAVVAVSTTRPHTTQVGVHPPPSWPISPPGTGGFTVDLTTGKATPLPAILAQNGDGGYAVSPDGTKIAYAINDSPYNPNNDSLYIANMDGTGSELIAPDHTMDTGSQTAMGPQWSPDGKLLVYQQRDGNSTALGNLYVYDLGTRRSTQITHLDQSTKTGGWWFMDPSFMPTDHGSAVLFQMPRGTNPQAWDLWSVPISGGKPVIVQKDAGWGSMAANGRLAYASPVSAATFNGAALYTSGLIGEPRVRQPLVKVVWSPDGDYIAYVGDSGIYVLSLGSVSATKVVEGGSVDWVNDNTLIVGP